MVITDKRRKKSERGLCRFSWSGFQNSRLVKRWNTRKKCFSTVKNRSKFPCFEPVICIYSSAYDLFCWTLDKFVCENVNIQAVQRRILKLQVEVERRKESIPKSSSPMEEVLAQLTQIPVEVNVKPVKTAIKSRKGLPAIIWVIGKKKYTLRNRSLNHSKSNRIIFLALTNFLSLPNCS